MQPQAPSGPTQEKQIIFNEESLAKKFSFSFTRKQLVILLNLISPMQFPLGDMRNRVLLGIIDDINAAAFNAITDKDLVQETPPIAPTVPIATN